MKKSYLINNCMQCKHNQWWRREIITVDFDPFFMDLNNPNHTYFQTGVYFKKPLSNCDFMMEDFGYHHHMHMLLLDMAAVS